MQSLQLMLGDYSWCGEEDLGDHVLLLVVYHLDVAVAAVLSHLHRAGSPKKCREKRYREESPQTTCHLEIIC